MTHSTHNPTQACSLFFSNVLAETRSWWWGKPNSKKGAPRVCFKRMFRQCGARRLQAGVHVPLGKMPNAAKMANWPEVKVPHNFRFTDEQRFRLKAMPRDTGRIPRDFVLTVLYRQQPCEIDKLWDYCSSDPRCVLDSKRHLRAVLKQAREEGFVTFEKLDAPEHVNTSSGGSEWRCVLTRERFGEVRQMMAKLTDAASAASSGLRGNNITETTATLEVFRGMNDEAKAEHVARLKEQVAATTEALRKFQRTEIDYLPYTDLNGKVQFMWWYETRDRVNRASETLPADDGAKAPAVVSESSTAELSPQQ